MTRSPRRLKEQVKDTVSELPIYAARLAVMGVGRALMLTDRVRKDYKEARETGLAPVLGRLRGDAENLTENVVGKVAGRVSGNGQAPETTRTDTDSEISVGKPPTKPAAAPEAKAAPAAPKAPAPKPAAAKPAAKPAETKPTAAKPSAAKATATSASKPAVKPAAKPAGSKPAAKATGATQRDAKAVTAKDLPVTGYDEATLASVRARLRGLDAKQVGELRDYERAHSARADFLRMYENRIAKLKSGS